MADLPLDESHVRFVHLDSMESAGEGGGVHGAALPRAQVVVMAFNRSGQAHEGQKTLDDTALAEICQVVRGCGVGGWVWMWLCVGGGVILGVDTRAYLWMRGGAWGCVWSCVYEGA